MMNKRLSLCFLALLLLSGKSFPQTDPSRYIAADGMFSFSIPSGWILREIPGRKYKAAFGQPIQGFAPNINVVDEAFSGPLNVYVDENLKVLGPAYETLGYRNFKVLSREVFTTSSRESGVRVVTQCEVNGKGMRQTFYFFDGKDGRKLVVTCTTIAEGGEEYDPVFGGPGQSVPKTRSRTK
jgi:hypothetical protein